MPDTSEAAVKDPPTPLVMPNPAAEDAGDPNETERPNDLKRMEAALKRANKEAEQARLKIKEYEDRDKSELELAQSQLAELEKNYATEQQQRLRLQVATVHSIGTDDLVLLTGTTEDELTAQATRIAALNAGRAAATATPAFAPSPGQTAGNGTPPAPTATVAAGADLYRQRNPRPTP